MSTPTATSHRGDPGTVLARWTPSRVAAAAAVAGLIGTIPALPSALSALLVAGFVLLGPGSLVVPLLGDLDAAARRVLVPVLGVSAMIIVAAASVALRFYSPRAMLLVAALVVLFVAVAGLARAASTRDAASTPAETS